jgi:hypothetical protein
MLLGHAAAVLALYTAYLLINATKIPSHVRGTGTAISFWARSPEFLNIFLTQDTSELGIRTLYSKILKYATMSCWSCAVS